MSAHDDPRVPNCKFSPTNGSVLHEAVGVEALRRDPFYRGGWAFNPWNGQRRAYSDVEMDPQCRGVWEPEWGPMRSALLAGVVADSHTHDVLTLSGETDPTGRGAHDAGAKLDAGKTRVWLCVAGFSRALEAVANITTKGAQKYADNSWMEVPNGESRYMDAFGRHMLDLGRGEVFDNGPGGTGGRHKAQMIWNLLASLELELRAEEKR